MLILCLVKCFLWAQDGLGVWKPSTICTFTLFYVAGRCKTVKGSWTVLQCFAHEVPELVMDQFVGTSWIKQQLSKWANQKSPKNMHCKSLSLQKSIKQNTLVVRVALLGTATSGRPKVFAFGNLVDRRIIMNHYHWLHLNSTISEWC